MSNDLISPFLHHPVKPIPYFETAPLEWLAVWSWGA